MKPKQINSKLLEFIPEIKEIFDSVTNWQGGLETGSTIVIEDVFMVYAKSCLEKNDNDQLIKCSNFLEWLSGFIEEEYAGDILVISVFEYIHFASDREKLEIILGPIAKEKYQSINWN